MINLFGKPKGIVYLERTGFKFFLSKKNLTASLEFEKGTMENLEYVNQGMLDTQVARFVQKYQLDPTSIVIVLSDSVMFSKKYTVKSLDKNNHAVNDFLQELPFVPDQIVYKSFELGYEPGKAIAVATNINVYIGLVGSFTRLGWNVRAIVPESAIGVVGVSVSSISQILKDKVMLQKADFLNSTPENILRKIKTSEDNKKSMDKQSKKENINSLSSLAFDEKPSEKEGPTGEDNKAQEPVGISKEVHILKEEKKRSPAFVPIVIILVILILSMGAYAYFKNQNQNQNDVPSISEEYDNINVDEKNEENLNSDTNPNSSLNSTVTPDTSPDTSISYLEKTDLSILILNGTGTAGLAGSVQDTLTALEYEDTEVGNSDDPFISDTLIYYSENVHPDNLNEIVNSLREDFTSVKTEKGVETSDYTITVVTGNLKE